MLFSIITVCFNSEKTIEKTIERMLQQTMQDFEYVIVDGGSIDGTLAIIKRYEPLFEGRMRWISESDQGIYDAMNKGIKMASGEIVGIVNSDDYYEKDTLEKVKEAYVGYKYTIIYGMLRTLYQGKEKMVYLKNPEFIEEDMIAHPSCFITRKLYEKYGLYSMEYPYSADYEFMLRIRQVKDIQYIPVYEVLSNFSVDGASSSVKGYRDTLKLKRKYELINSQIYNKEMVKSWISLKIRK